MSLTSIVGVDPGYEMSAWVRYDGQRVVAHAIEANAELLERLAGAEDSHVTFEAIESYGMAVGREVFETVFWTGRFFEAVVRRGANASRLPRKAVKLHLCHSARATDSNLRVALLDRFGGSAAAVGKKAAPGPLYGIKSHEWAALALAVTWLDTSRSNNV